MRLNIAPRAANLEYAIRDIVVEAKKIEKTTSEKMIYLNIGDPIAYDWKTPEHMRKALAEATEEGYNGYSPSLGLQELREAIVEKEKRVAGADIDIDHIIVTAGVSESIEFLLGSLILNGNEFLIPGPSYPPYISYTYFFGGKPVSYRMIEEENWKPDIDDLRKKINDKTIAILVITPNNPTGAAIDEKTMKAMIDLAGEYELPLISDEIYDMMTFSGKHVSAARLAKDVPIIGFNGISKVYLAPGWRIGWTYFQDPEGKLAPLKDAMERQARVRICTNTVAQKAAIAALKGPQDHIKKTLEELKKRRDYIYKRLNAIDGISTTLPDAAFYIMPKIDLKGKWKDDKDFVLSVLKEEKIVFVNGSGFDPEYGAGHFRSVYLPPINMLEEAMDRLERFMKKHY